MTERKLSLTITSLTLLICILFSGVLYSISKSVVGNNFQSDMNFVTRNIDSDANSENKTLTPNEYAKILCNHQIKWMPYDNALQYPFTFAVYDSKGNLIEKYGYYILTDDEYINIDKYMTDDIINKFKSTFENASGVTLDNFSYYKKDGKKVVTKMSFYDFNTKKSLDITLNKYSGKTITKQNVGTHDDENAIGISFDFSKMYQNKQNRKIQAQIDKEVLSQQGMYQKGLYGNNGIFGPEKSEQSSTFGDKNNKYTAYYIFQYDVFYNATKSYTFQYGIQILVFIFIFVSLILSIGACKIFRKKKEFDDAKEAFTSGAAHELKTPITIINNQCECLIKNVSPEKNSEYIAAIYRQNKHMSALVNKLLQFNRISKETLNKTKFDIKALAEEEINKYKMLADEHGITIETNLDSKEVNADRDLIALVIDNYLSNAVKNTKNGGKIRVEFSDKKLGVFNEGKPIDSRISGKIWEVFTRSEENDVITSHGMGLATCKKILELHKFKYGYLNRLSGVEFYFEIK